MFFEDWSGVARKILYMGFKMSLSLLLRLCNAVKSNSLLFSRFPLALHLTPSVKYVVDFFRRVVFGLNLLDLSRKELLMKGREWHRAGTHTRTWLFVRVERVLLKRCHVCPVKLIFSAREELRIVAIPVYCIYGIMHS